MFVRFKYLLMTSKIAIQLKVLEQYCRLKDFPNYAISNWGRIINIKKQTILKGTLRKTGYVFATLYRGDKYSAHSIHRLVAQSFIRNPESLSEVDHIDRCKSNNLVSNLRWSTGTDNMLNRDHNNLKNGLPTSSQYRGVHRKNKNSNRWQCQITIDGEKKHIGMFDSEVEGAKAYNDYIEAHNLKHPKNLI